MYILGPEVAALETEIADYLGVHHAIGVSSGTDALLMAFMALGIGPGDEVIVPDFSFFATAGCVARLGATPVFVDVEPKGFMVNPELVEQAITPKTKAIVPVHLFGQAADMESLLQISEKYNIPIVEDAAQAIGTQASDGRRVGGLGLIGCFSFYPTKNLGAFGDAGLITTNNSELANTLRQMRNHGMEPRYYHRFVGGNFRLDAMQAAVLRVKLPYLPQWHEGRRRNASLYSELFIRAGLSAPDAQTEITADHPVLLPIALHPEPWVDHHIFNQFTIRVHNRNELRNYLSSRNIGTEIYYPVPLHAQECFSYLAADGASFPVTSSLCESVLSLPIYPELQEEHIHDVVATVADFYRT